MKHDIVMVDGKKIAVIKERDTVISNAQAFLEMVMNLQCDGLVLPKENLADHFFDLRTGLAGEIAQKAINYRVKLAIVGDVSGYTSKSLRAFIVESNRSATIRFCETVAEALNHIKNVT